MIHVQQADLNTALAIVQRATTRSSLPILGCVLIEHTNDTVTITGNNLDMAIRSALPITTTQPIKRKEAPSYAVPAKFFADLVDNLSNVPVTLAHDGQKSLQLTAGGTTATIQTLDEDDFPSLPDLSECERIAQIPLAILKEGIRFASKASSTDHVNPVLQGVLMRFRGHEVTFAAIDGFRLAEHTFTLATPADEDADYIIPARNAIEFMKVLEGDIVDLYVTDTKGQVLFVGNCTCITRLIDGRFPSYAQFVPDPDDFTASALIQRSELIKAVKRVALFASASDKIVAMTLDPATNTLRMHSNAQEIGANDEVMDVTLTSSSNQPASIAFNINYLTDAVNAFTGEHIMLRRVSADKPGVFTPTVDNHSFHMVMPMKMPGATK